eukprot:383739_1
MGACATTTQKEQIYYEHNNESQSEENTNITSKDVTIILKFNNSDHEWNPSKRSLSTLTQFVRNKFKINDFELEYKDDDNNICVIEDDDLLSEAINTAASLQTSLIINVAANDTVNVISSSPRSKKHVDVNVFKDDSTDCTSGFICFCTERIVNAIKYYQALNMGSIDAKNQLTQFYDETYPHMLNDFTHIITKHPDSLDSMYDFATKVLGLGKCTAKKCYRLRRHNRNRDDEKETLTNKDIKFQFKRDLMDAIHCYVLHQYDFGYAIYNKQQKIDEELKEAKYDDEYKDNAFALISKLVQDAKKNQEKFERFKKHNKYNLEIERTKTEKDMECMEAILIRVGDNNSPLLHKFLEKEDYDTDAIKADILYHKEGKPSNIYPYLPNAIVYKTIKKYIRKCEISERSFKQGFIYYYWPYYDDKKHEEEDFRNINDHSGYQKHELYVDIKYENIKQEMLNNTILSLTEGQYQVSLTKAENLFKVDHVKEMKASDRKGQLHYDINAGDPIKLEHLLAVILYTDWSDLCTKFSSTFRKKLYHPLEKAKTQNAEYGNWSKLLREAIQFYGQSGEGEIDEITKQIVNKLKGPFFCGVKQMMVIYSFNIRLCCPTSTSNKVEISCNFCADEGIIMQFNNNGDHTSKTLRAFPCAWISNYGEESEYLFMGGHARMRVETVKIQRTKQNFVKIIRPLFYLDCMINGTWMDEEFKAESISKEDHTYLDNLIKYHLNSDTMKNPYPMYTHNVFESFCYKKTQVVINLDELHNNLQVLCDIVIDPITNLFKDVLYDLFESLEKIIYYTTSPDGKSSHTLEWESLLTLIDSSKASNKLTITINANCEYDRYYHKRSWMFFEKKPEIISEYFEDNGWGCDVTSKRIDTEYIERVELYR